ETIQRLVPSAELMRFSLSGSEAVQTAFRIARAKTGKSKFLRFEGHYHGWLDNVAWGLSIPESEDLGERTSPKVFPWTEGLPVHSREEFEILPWNDLGLVEDFLSSHHHEIAAIITEPIMCNKGCILPREGFLEGLRELCTYYDIALIFDEVITGFRMHLGGAQTYFNIKPDISIFAKALASGYPLSAVAGSRKWMEVVVQGKALHAGTMNSGNGPVAAALATLKVLEREKPHERMFSLGQRLISGLRESARQHNHNMLVTGPGPMLCTSFTDKESVTDFRDTLSSDGNKLRTFIIGLQEEGIRVIGRGLWYISTAHTENDIDVAIAAADRVLASMEK
ncbi:MAG TPA: aminotransferase class III-fold pyridoxal phosphate-dependent enzyme, partial [Membranihabitans sp.]|nr:aminotransferase class III-fold pyridoxal phosphate-dependent enzyme [Membranihabitans sp.]